MILLPLLLVVPLANPPRVVNQSDVDALWEFVQTLTASRNLPPEVYFALEEEPPPSPSFLAYYYEHTRVVRVSPLAVKTDRGLGSVYVVLGHEMLHYALADHEPVAKHHCLFAQEVLSRADRGVPDHDRDRPPGAALDAGCRRRV